MYSCSMAMRTHTQIVQAFGASNLVRALRERGINVHQSTPQRWADRNSIPGEYWRPLEDLGAATLPELAEAASVENRSGEAA